MKKKTLSIIAAALAVLILLPLVMGVGLQEIFGLLSSSSYSSYITFYNARNQETSLFVRKTVKASAGYNAPTEDEFEFILKINDAVARDREYTLFDASGRKIYVYDKNGETIYTTVEDKTQFEVALKTDRYGRFTLKAGYTAAFEGLYPGDTYDVSELPRVPYIQETPAEGISLIGTLTNDGAVEEFVNLYPRTDEDVIEVRKNVSYPKGYDIPETPDFTFEISVEGKPLANTEFVIKDIKTEKVLDGDAGNGITDAFGRFTLQGGTFAVFSNIPVDVDYSVKELLSEADKEKGWRVLGDEVQEGATSESGTIVSYTNALASFVVSKDILGGAASDGTAFEFQVLGKDGKPFGESLSYYLYNAAGKLVDESLFSTAKDGTFTIEAGQRAVFVGLSVGTEYGVKETASGQYVQYLPASELGYQDKTVKDTAEVLPFVNAAIPTKTLLTVKKSVEDNSDDLSMPTDTVFKFRISKLEKGAYVPMADEPYDIVDANGTRTYSTDADGIFTLKAWEIARFIELSKNGTYIVEEILDSSGSAQTNGPTFEIAGSAVTEELQFEDGQPIQVEFLNSYDEPENPYIRIRKEKQSNQNLLPGAVLQLITKDEDGNAVEILHEWTSKNSEEVFQVEPGTYYIREKNAPSGYKTAEDVEIKVEASSDTTEVPVFKIVNDRDQNVPTGVAALRSPIVRAIIALVIVLAVLAAVYFGYIRKRRSAK